MKKLNRFVPSPALVIACVALFVAMGGSAYAVATGAINGREVKNYSLTGKDIKKDGLGGVSIKESRLGTVGSADTLSHTATVAAAGQLVRGRGVTAAARTSEGQYQVTFNRNVQGCVAVASVGDPSAAAPPNGQATTSFLVTNGNVVRVRTAAANDGSVANRGFNLIVSC